MKKIVIDARESGTSTGRYVDKLIEYLHDLRPGFQIIILTKRHRMDFIKDIAPHFKIVETGYREFSFGEQIGFLRQIKSLKPDLVHFAMVQQPVRYHGKVVTTMHDLTTTRFNNPSKNASSFMAKQKVYTWLNKKAAHKSAAIITPSEFVKDDVAQFAGIDPRKIIVTYEAADIISDAAEVINGLEGKKFIIYVGRPQPHKNLGRLVEAFKLLQKTHPDLCLVLAGKKDILYERIEQQAHQKRIKNIIFTDFISEGQLRWLYENCQAYIFPSLSEGFGLPGLEAMMHGAPVVSSNATCLPEIYQGAAHYFDPLNAQEMAAKIAEVLDDDHLRAELINAGKMHAASFSWKRTAWQTLAIYQKLFD
ncbi:MAG: glycosyltransferase family 4 protein [Candidatus Saccharimonadales bacterium]